MEFFLLKLVVLLRPLASIEYAKAVFDIAGIAIFGLIVAMFLSNSALRKSISFSAIDFFILSFAAWCISVDLIYLKDIEGIDNMLRGIAKVLIPLLTYTVVRNVVRDHSQYKSLFFWMIIGFSVPAIWSAILISIGKGVFYISYYTEIERWKGVYTGSHNLGHSMTLFIIVLVLYSHIYMFNERDLSRNLSSAKKVILLVLGGVALYCLYKSQVRTAIVGLIVFSAIYLYAYNKKLLLIVAIATGIFGTATIHFWLPTLLPEFALEQKGIEVKTEDLGSGRPRMWSHDLQVFANFPIDRQIAGVGLGGEQTETTGEQLYGHNDWLEVLTQTGIVGILLFATLQILFLRAILRLPKQERYVYFALFAAVQIMMMLSNSYLWRIQVGHLYYILLAFIEIPSKQREHSEQKNALHELGNNLRRTP